MSVMIQVRNVPESLHVELVRRAEERGLSLTAYIQEILEREVSLPSREEVLRRLRGLKRVELDFPVAELIREGRRERYGDDE
jgi:plasmid stability protein